MFRFLALKITQKNIYIQEKKAFSKRFAVSMFHSCPNHPKVKSLVKPWTRNTGCSIALRMNPEKVLQAEATQKPREDLGSIGNSMVVCKWVQLSSGMS